jgi:hypothetical protein
MHIDAYDACSGQISGMNQAIYQCSASALDMFLFFHWCFLPLFVCVSIPRMLDRVLMHGPGLGSSAAGTWDFTGTTRDVGDWDVGLWCLR